MTLQAEADFLNEEYKRCFGVYPKPMVEHGVQMVHVHEVQSALFRYWIEEMKVAVALSRGEKE